MNDIAKDANAKPILDDLTNELLAVLDPVETDRLAKADQAKLMEASGGRAAVIERGDLGFSPPPGVPPDFN